MNRIASLRKERNLTQKEFGAIIGVAQNTICNWENGKREPDNESLKKMAFFFGCSTDYLLGTASFGRSFVFDDDIQSDKNLDWAGRPQTDGGQKEKPTPVSEDGLNKRLIDRLVQLSPEEQEKVEVFVQGMIAGRATNGA